MRDWGLDRDIAHALKDFGGVARQRRNYDEAERKYLEALQLSQGDEEMRAVLNGSLGELALDRKQWVEARKWFEEALSLAKEVGRQALIAEAQHGLARVEEAEGRADLALPLAQEALKIYERLQHGDLAEVRELVERLSADMKRKSG